MALHHKRSATGRHELLPASNAREIVLVPVVPIKTVASWTFGRGTVVSELYKSAEREKHQLIALDSYNMARSATPYCFCGTYVSLSLRDASLRLIHLLLWSGDIYFTQDTFTPRRSAGINYRTGSVNLRSTMYMYLLNIGIPITTFNQVLS